MRSSVLLTGDAGGLTYIDKQMDTVPTYTFSLCCSSCSVPDVPKSERNLMPITRKPMEQKQFNQYAENETEQFRWTSAIIGKYSNTQTMRK
jgi:hypothetical protein